MASVSLKLQEGIYGVLNGNVSCSVYDHIPQGSAFPYVTIGHDVVTMFDDITEERFEITATIDTWAKYAGKKTVKEIQDEVFNLIHKQENTFTITGYVLILARLEFEEVFIQTDEEAGQDKYVHGVQRFRFIIEKE